MAARGAALGRRAVPVLVRCFFGSVLWFTVLGYGARGLSRILASPRAWRVLDVVISVVLAALAVKLILESSVWG